MDDRTIIQHYWDRDECAITETDEKYGSYCHKIAENILENSEDAKECVNDTYLKTWNSVPPEWPKIFPAFIGKIVRNTAFNYYTRIHARKRGGSMTAVVLEELDECIPDKNAEFIQDDSELTGIINTFLESLSERNREIFVLRYWYNEKISYIAETMKMSENSIFSVLNRMRKKLRKNLEEKGVKP